MSEIPGRDDPADTVDGVVPSPQAAAPDVADPGPMPNPRHDVHRYLVTAPDDLRMDLWAATAMFSNWLEGRTNGDRETWMATVSPSDSASFLTAAETIGVTVEEIVGAGPPETYELRVGEPGTGWWQVGDQLAPDTADRVDEGSRRAERSLPQDVVNRLAADLGLADPADLADMVEGVEDLAAEFAALPDCPHCEGTGKDVPQGWISRAAAAMFADQADPKGDNDGVEDGRG